MEAFAPEDCAEKRTSAAEATKCDIRGGTPEAAPFPDFSAALKSIQNRKLESKGRDNEIRVQELEASS